MYELNIDIQKRDYYMYKVLIEVNIAWWVIITLHP